MKRVMFGAGIDAYVELPELTWAVDDVRQVARRLREGGFDVVTTFDGRRGDVVDALDRIGRPDDGLVVLWAGHGERSARGTLRLFTVENAASDGDMKLITVDELAECIAATQARQVLLVVDTCYSGGAAMDVSGVVAALKDRIETGERRWIGVLTASRKHEPAIDGLLAQKLVELLDYGPRNPRLRLRWSAFEQFLRGDDLADALFDEWTDPRHRPRFVTDGEAQPFLPNPLYREGASERIVEHLLWSARGGAQSEAGFWFTGRGEQLRTIVGWIAGAEPGLCLVTGPAGSGKSAVLGRVVSLADPAERDEIANATGLPPAGEDPGEGAVAAHVQVRGMTLEQLASALAGQLNTGGSHYREVLDTLSRRNPPPLIVIDGLDEAGAAVPEIAHEFLAPLARLARVLIATRSVPEPLEGLTIALDDAPVHDYVLDRLKGTGLDERRIADAIDGPFLLARIVTSQLIADPESAGDLPQTIDEAFIRDVGDDQRALGLLTALAYSYGQGFPEDVWAAVAGATRDDVLAVLAEYGRYITVSSLRGQAVYRLHQRIAETRRRDPAQAAPAVLASYERHLDRGLAAAAHPYLWGYVARHAADGGPPAIERLEALAQRDPALHTDAGFAWHGLGHAFAEAGDAVAALEPLERAVAVFARIDDAQHLADALNELGICLIEAGRWQAAVEPLEGALALRERLAEENPAFLGDLAASHNNLGGCYSDLGRHAEALEQTERAVAIREQLPGADPAGLAGSLINLAARYGESGRSGEAVAPAERAVAIRERLAAMDPEQRGSLARALVNLGIHLSAVASDDEALAASERAVAILEDQPASRDLANAYVNLGLQLSRIGRHRDALAPNAQAVAIYEQLVDANPGVRDSLAAALINLAARYNDVGRPQDALDVVTRAVALFEQLAVENPAFRLALAKALGNLGVYLAALGRPAEALAPANRSVGLLAEQPAARTDLARALSILANHLGAVGRHSEALTTAERAVPLYEDHPADLAAALHDLGVRYHEAGRTRDAIAPAQRAVAIRERLAAEQPGLRGHLARSLSALGGHYAELGQPEEAIGPTERAAVIFAELVGENPAYRGELAGALGNAAIVQAALGKPEAAVTAAELAAELYSHLAAENPVFRGPAAGALGNLAILRADDEDFARAVAAYEALAAENPAFLRDLARTLNNFDRDDAWTAAYARFAGDPYAGALLRTRRRDASLAELMTALELDAGDDPFLTADLHDALRAHRPAWEGDPPAWLTLDDALFDAAFAWLNADTMRESRARLDPRLLTDAGEAVLAEIALRHPGDERLEAHRNLLANARGHGVTAAYAPLLAEDAYRTWEALGDPAERRRFLEANLELMLSVEDPVMAARVTAAARGLRH